MVLGRESTGQVLASGGGNFGFSESHEFVLPAEYKDGDDDDEPIIGEGEIPLTIEIQVRTKNTRNW